MKKKDKSVEICVNQFVNRLKESNEEQIINEAFQNIQQVREVDVDKAFEAVNQQIYKSQNKTRFLVRLQRIAAVLFLPLLAISMYLTFTGDSASLKTVSRTIENPSGVRSQLELPDGTTLWLNSGSSITYAEPFKRRYISLQGEAFFDVAKDERKPFIVEAGKLNVKVLGTRFNVMAYPEDHNIEVALEEGSVSLLTQESNGLREYRMKPDNRAVFNKKTKLTSIHTENLEKYIAWHKGKLIFDNTPLNEVALTLSRWYGINISIQSEEVGRYRFTSTFENESIHTVIELLELCSPIKTEYIPSQIQNNGLIDKKGHLIIEKE